MNYGVIECIQLTSFVQQFLFLTLISFRMSEIKIEIYTNRTYQYNFYNLTNGGMQTMILFTALCLTVSSVVLVDSNPINKNVLSNGWYQTSESIDKHSLISFSIVLKLSNVDYLLDEVREISNPMSDRYCEFKTRDELNDILRPDHNVSLLMNYLGENSYCTDNYISIKCDMPIHQTERLFDTKFAKYVKNGKTHHAGKTYSIPTEFQDDIHFVLGLVDFPHVDEITPIVRPRQNYSVIARESLFSLYNITDDPQNVSSTQAVIEYLDDNCFNMDDFVLFQIQNGMPKMTNVSIYGTCDTSTPEPDIEASLDIQYQCATGNCQSQQYISSSGWLLDVLQMMYTLDAPPLVTSASWGWWEGDQSSIVAVDNEEYVKQCNLMYGIMSLRGCTFVASSGDSGASGRTNEQCSLKPYLRAVYPTSSPYVVSVGGTTFFNETTGGTSPFCKHNDCVMTADEINTMFDNVEWASGSGISNYSEREYWSLTENRHYLQNVTAGYLPHPNEYFALGRQYPDVAMMAHNYMVAIMGGFMAVDGTSCSSPAFSGLITRLNSVRLNNGCPPFGAFGPFMYMMYEQCPTCFVDKVVGCSNSTESGDCPPNIREYCATTGYDTIYGLGLPNYGEMANYTKTQCLSMKKR